MPKPRRGDHTPYIPYPGFVYVFQTVPRHVLDPVWYKIGRSGKPVARQQKISGGSPLEVERMIVLPTNHEVWAERQLHACYWHCRMNGEWFECPDSEFNWLRELTHYDDPLLPPSNLLTFPADTDSLERAS